MQNERKYPQNERKFPQTSANLKTVTMPAFLWMEEGDLVERFSGGERFLGGRAEIGNSSVFFLVPNKKGTLGASGLFFFFVKKKTLKKSEGGTKHMTR